MAQTWKRVARTTEGSFRIRLSSVERDALRALPQQLRDLLDSDDPVLERLFPSAYPDDPEASAEYRRLVAGDLRRQRLSSLETMERTLDSDELSQEDMEAWLSAVNDLRLVLGTRLDVTEDMTPESVPETDPNFPAFAMYQYLSGLEWEVVEALGEGVDPMATAEPPEA